MTTRLLDLDQFPSKASTIGDKEGTDLKVDVIFNEPEDLEVPRHGGPLGSASRDDNEVKFSRLWNFWREPKLDLDAVATQLSVFDDKTTLEIYRPPPEYENVHRFDPLARWTWREERSIVRKIDFRIMIWTFFMFFSLELDRTNLSQANSDNFLDNLRLTTNDFNLANTIFRLTFLSAEFPSQLVSKRLGPDVWIPCQMVLWSIVSFSQFWLKDRTGFLVCRALLGFLQGGFIPNVVLYLSYFYTKSELPMRLAVFWVSNYAADITGAFIATGVLRIHNGKEAWRYLFLIEGLFTLLAGFFSFFLMPPGPTQTKAWYRPKGWFSEREEVVMVNRILRDDPSKSDMHNREGLTLRMIWQSLKDWRMWPLYAIGITHLLPVSPPQTYLTLSLRHLGFSTFKTNLLSIPSYTFGVIMLIFMALVSEVINSRAGTTIFLQLCILPLLITLYRFTAETSQWAYFAVVTLITGLPYVHPIQVAWTSRNSHSVRTRTVSASVYNMCVQTGQIISANIYRTDDKPLYKRGNRQLIAICSMNIVLYIGIYFFYRTINAKREKIWSEWSPQERRKYLETTKDEGNQRMDFRFAY